MEGYGLEGLAASGDPGLGGLAASAELVVEGLGPLAAGLALLAGDARRAVTLDAMEALVTERGRELLRGVVQLSLDAQAAAEVKVAGVTGGDGVRRGRTERGHGRPVVTTLGEVRVRRIAYRAGVKGVRSLFPRDAVLSLPPVEYSWQLQRLAEMFSRCGSYEQAGELVLAVTGVRIGKRQLEEITVRAAADAEQFTGRPRDVAEGPAGTGTSDGDGEEGLLPLVISVDGKGVAMRPEARRKRYGKAAQRSKSYEKRLGTGEKNGVKRMAHVAVVFDALPPDDPRTPELIMGCAPPGPGGTPPAKAGQVRAQGRWYTTDLTAGRDATIRKAFAEATRRDPGHQRDWVVLVDGDSHQITAIQDEAARLGVTITILIDLIHVLEYLWKAAWCFHPPRDPAAEAWVGAQATSILHGHAATVITRIQDLAARHPPRPGSEHDKNIRKTLTYLTNKQPYLNYPAALAKGWPIATSVIEGACRHLIADRMGITGARWGLPGAEAILWLRAIHANDDLDAYWAYHLQQEHHRNHLSRYHPDHRTHLALAA